MYSIRKTMRFEMAHRLIHGYVGNCSSNHGHSAVVTVELESPSLDGFGMVRDFADVKVMKKWIDDNLDHATLISGDDLPFLIWLKDHGQRFFVIPSYSDGPEVKQPNPTSENICRLLYEKAHELGLKEVIAVEMDETCTSKARYSR